MRLFVLGWPLGLVVLLGGPHLAVMCGLIDRSWPPGHWGPFGGGPNPTTLWQQEVMTGATTAAALLIFVAVLWICGRRLSAPDETALVPAFIAQGILVGSAPLPLSLITDTNLMAAPVWFVTIVGFLTMVAAAFVVATPSRLWQRLCLFPVAGLMATATAYWVMNLTLGFLAMAGGP